MPQPDRLGFDLVTDSEENFKGHVESIGFSVVWVRMRVSGFLKGLATGTVFNPSRMISAIFISVVDSFTLVPSSRKSASRALGGFSY